MKYKQLTEISTPKQWKTISSDMLTESGYPVYGASGIIGYYKDYNHKKPTVTIGCRGTCGKINFVSEKAYINGNAMCIDNLSDEFDEEFLYYYLQQYDFSKVISGSTIPQITISSLEKVFIPIIPKIEQIGIVKKMRCIDEAISESKKRLNLYDELVKSRFVELFGDCNKQTSIKESGLTISDGNYSSKYPRSEEFVERGIPFIRANNLKNGTVVDEDMYYITPEKHKILLKGHLKPNDILITTRGNIGQVAIVPEQHNDSNINAQIVLLRDENGRFIPQYLLWALQTEKVKVQYIELQTGTALKQLPVGRLEQVIIKEPPIEQQNEFAAFVEQTDKSKLATTETLKYLEELKASLMAKYFG